MYCANCGAELKDEQIHFCPNCGKPVGGTASGTPQAGAAPAVAEMPRKGMRLWVKILIGVVVAIGAIIAFAVIATAPLVDPIEAHLALLREGKVAEAWEATSGQFKGSTSQADFERFVAANPKITQIKSHSFANKSWENDLGEVRGTLTADDGSSIPVFYRLIREQGEWRILSISFNPADQQQ